MLQKEWILSLLYIGSSNLVAISWVILISTKSFNYPILLLAVAYLGQYMCLPLHKIASKELLQTKPYIAPYKYWVPTLLGLTANMLQIYCRAWIPTNTTNPFVGISLFVSIVLSPIVFRKSIPRHQIFAFILIIIGDVFCLINLLLNGDFSIFSSVCIAISQILISLQICIEEYYFKNYEIEAMQCAGYEGLIGTTIFTLLFPILQNVSISDDPLENTIKAFGIMSESRFIIMLCIVIVLASCAVEMSGQAITKELSGVHKVILVQFKYATLWVELIVLNKLSISIWPTIGYVMVVLATLIFHEVIVLTVCNMDFFTKAKLNDRQYFKPQASDSDM